MRTAGDNPVRSRGCSENGHPKKGLEATPLDEHIGEGSGTVLREDEPNFSAK